MPSSAYKEDDPLKIKLKIVCDHFDHEDEDVRQFQVRFYKRLKYYWNNFSQIFWSGQDNDYRIWGRDEDSSGSDDQAFYDRPVNVFKAFLETIIAALSTQVPAVQCVPDDADNPADVSTAKAGNIISKLIYKHCDAILIWLQMLYVYCTEGMIAVYNYPHASEEYGTYRVKNYKDIPTIGYFCPECEQQLDEEMVMQSRMYEESLRNKYDPDLSDDKLLEAQDDANPITTPEGELKPIVCPNCAVKIDPGLQQTKLLISRFVGYKNKPKNRVCIEVYGGLYIKVANYAKKQCDTPYLRLAYETNYVNTIQEYPDLKDKLPQGGNIGVNDPYEQYARLNIQYRNAYPQDLVTVKHMWLRPSSYHILSNDQGYNDVKRKYPNGCKVVIVNDIIAECTAENLDDHWTLSRNPMSDYLTFQPLGELLTNIQDIVNDLISLTLQTIEQAIPTVWVDPAIVNVNEYGQVEATPGNTVPVKPVPSNKNISEGFHSTQASALAPEVFTFFNIIQELGQFVSGALPSIFGGAMPGSGETAAEYQMSQQMALQRLQTPWKMLTILWKEVMGKAIPMYMKMMVEDERYVDKDEQGNFINVFIRKSETMGKIGEVTLDNSDQLPVTEAQQKQIIMELMGLNNMEVFNALVAPENLPWIRKIVRIPEFKLPGENDRQKQLEEIQELLNTVPIPTGQVGLDGQEVMLPSVEIDVVLDNHKEHADLLRNWLIGEAGRLAKKENPEGYMNNMLHFQAHVTEMNRAMQMQQMQAAQMAGGKPNEQGGTKPASGKPNQTPKSKPETQGVGNVNNVQ